MYDFHKVLFLLPSKNQRIYQQARYHAGFRQKWRNNAPITPPPKNQYLQMQNHQLILQSTATKTLKHWQVLT